MTKSEVDLDAVNARVSAESARFRALLPELLLHGHRGKWVLFRDGAVVSFHKTGDEAYVAGLDAFGPYGGQVIAEVTDETISIYDLGSAGVGILEDIMRADLGQRFLAEIGLIVAVCRRFEAATYELVVSVRHPKWDHWSCRICRAVDPKRNPYGYTNTEHKTGCPFNPKNWET